MICYGNIVNVVLFYFIWVFFFFLGSFQGNKYFVLNGSTSSISKSNLINERHVCKKNYSLIHAFHLLMD